MGKDTFRREQRQQAEGFFTVIRRERPQLTAVPYSQAYAADLKKAAGLLREAAALPTTRRSGSS